MNEKLVGVVLNMGAVNQLKEASERIDVKSRVEEEKFRKLSADLERRRVRRFNQHVEEQEKVKKELVGLQRDRVRFEREKVLRRRNTFSTGRERSRQSAPGTPHCSESKLPKENTFSGGSASIAFDPSTLKYGSRNGRRTKTVPPISCSTGKMVAKELLQWQDADTESHQVECSGRPSETKSWGAAWLDAKKEQTTKGESRNKWTSLMLKVEKDKMKVLSGKCIALKESKLASIKNVLNKKHRDGSEPGNDEDGTSIVEELKFAGREIGSSRVWSDKKPLLSPEARFSKYSRRSAKNQGAEAEKYKRQEPGEEETKMPSIFFKELNGISEISLNDQMVKSRRHDRCSNVSLINEDHVEQGGDKLLKEARKNKTPLPVVVGSFLPQLQND